MVFAFALAWTLAAPLGAEEAARFDPGVARRITPEQVQRRRDAGKRVTLLDTRRSPSDVIVKGAVQVPNDKIKEWAKDARKDALIVTYCT